MCSARRPPLIMGTPAWNHFMQCWRSWQIAKSNIAQIWVTRQPLHNKFVCDCSLVQWWRWCGCDLFLWRDWLFHVLIFRELICWFLCSDTPLCLGGISSSIIMPLNDIVVPYICTWWKIRIIIFSVPPSSLSSSFQIFCYYSFQPFLYGLYHGAAACSPLSVRSWMTRFLPFASADFTAACEAAGS